MINTKTLYNESDLLREQKVSEDSIRSPFRRDFARLIHSAAFRRLQGKTQLFPLSESDFFRNRLTHSLEVAQIAKCIAILINTNFIAKELEKNEIKDKENYFLDYDLVEFASLAHDLGHPPFGHKGESALDENMKEYGGFESNAQNLRILTRLEKKEKKTKEISGIESGIDKRLGLNLTYRSLSSILKYDRQIPKNDNTRKSPIKGYYNTESEIVKRIKNHVAGRENIQNFKTIECQIMDIADDIAYSTYDLEDAFKTNFLNPIGMLGEKDLFLKLVSQSVRDSINDQTFSIQDLKEILHEIFKGIAADFDIRATLASIPDETYDLIIAQEWAIDAFVVSNKLCRIGYERTQFTSHLVDNAVKSVEFEFNPDCPALSKAFLKPDIQKRVAVLKYFVYHAVIQQSRLQIVEGRGGDIVSSIFKKIDSEGGDKLLPPDFNELYNSFSDVENRKRTISDFIASMTDRYAIEFYKRLFSVDAETIFKEL